MVLTAGARTFIRTLKRLGYRVAIISGGFTHFTDVLAKDLDLDHAYANKLEVIDGVITGRIEGDIVDAETKAKLLELVALEEGIPLEQTVAIGDGANDLPMLQKAGLGIAFNAKPVFCSQSKAPRIPTETSSMPSRKRLQSNLYCGTLNSRGVHNFRELLK